jgi:hypothetical protein
MRFSTQYLRTILSETIHCAAVSCTVLYFIFITLPHDRKTANNTMCRKVFRTAELLPE